jgi:hypothetical protein
MYIGIGTVVVIVIIVLVILMLRRRLCCAAAPGPQALREPHGTQGFSGGFQPGRRGQQVPRSVAVERLRVRARWAKSRRIRPGSECLHRYRRSIPRRHPQ